MHRVCALCLHTRRVPVESLARVAHAGMYSRASRSLFPAPPPSTQSTHEALRRGGETTADQLCTLKQHSSKRTPPHLVSELDTGASERASDRQTPGTSTVRA